MDIRVREMCADDVPFVASTWVMGKVPWRGRKHETAGRIRLRSAFTRDICLILGEANVLIACSPESESTIHGWVCSVSGDVLQIYVRHDVIDGNLMRGIRGPLASKSTLGRVLLAEVSNAESKD